MFKKVQKSSKESKTVENDLDRALLCYLLDDRVLGLQGYAKLFIIQTDSNVIIGLYIVSKSLGHSFWISQYLPGRPFNLHTFQTTIHKCVLMYIRSVRKLSCKGSGVDDFKGNAKAFNISKCSKILKTCIPL